MKQYLLLLISITSFVSCNNSTNSSFDFNFQATECYHLYDIFSSFNEMDSLIKESNVRSDGIVHDSMLTEFVLEKETIDIGPVFKIYSPSIKMVDGKPYLDSSAVLGNVNDTVKFIKYITEYAHLFPSDIEWEFANSAIPEISLLFGKKKEGKVIRISINDIDSIYVEAPLMKTTKLLDKDDSFSRYSYGIRLKPNILDQLDSGSFVITSDSNIWTTVSYNSKNSIFGFGSITSSDLKRMNDLMGDRIVLND